MYIKMPKTNENNILVRNMESVGGDKLLWILAINNLIWEANSYETANSMTIAHLKFSSFGFVEGS